MQRISDLFVKNARGWLILLLLAAVIFLNAVVFADMSAVLGETGPIDLQFFYTPERVYGMVEAYGPEVRIQYRTFALTADVIYPVVYTLLFGLLISWLFRRGLAPDSRLHGLNLVPLGAGIFDLLENLAIAGMLTIHPSTPAWLAWAATVLTMAKWLFAAASLGLLLYGLVLAVRKALARPSGSPA